MGREGKEGKGKGEKGKGREGMGREGKEGMAPLTAIPGSALVLRQDEPTEALCG